MAPHADDSASRRDQSKTFCYQLKLYSNSLDDEPIVNDTFLGDDHADVAIRTAKIFRGITVDNNNNNSKIVSRSCRGKTYQATNPDQKSRQSVQIDKAASLHDLVPVDDDTIPNPEKFRMLSADSTYDDLKTMIVKALFSSKENRTWKVEVLDSCCLRDIHSMFLNDYLSQGFRFGGVCVVAFALMQAAHLVRKLPV